MAMTLPPLALYAHFPWCVRKCPYCDFNSYALRTALPEQHYVDALISDLRAQAQEQELCARPLVSVFLGGGTPSLFSPAAIERVLVAARDAFGFDDGVEITLEANPGTIERGRFAEYRAAGVTRVSLGAQSFDAATLAKLGRIHSPDETRRAASELHAAGLANFNLDLMYALPGQDLAGALADVRQALELAPAHLSHYQLTLEPGTVFAAHPPPLPPEDAAAAMHAQCTQLLAGAGFARYEVSAYARAGARCRHNLNYWNFGDYLGVGAGAHGKLTCSHDADIVRTTQLREPRRYLAAADAVLARRSIPPRELLRAHRAAVGERRRGARAAAPARPARGERGGLSSERSGAAVPQRPAARISARNAEEFWAFRVVNGSAGGLHGHVKNLYSQVGAAAPKNESITRKSRQAAGHHASKSLMKQVEIA